MSFQGSHTSRPGARFLGRCIALALFASFTFSIHAQAASLILNEFNCVDSDSYLLAGSYRNGVAPDLKEDSYFRGVLDTADDGLLNGSNNGRIEGNGGNWVELVVTQDHLDVRGWQLKWAEPGVDVPATNGTDPWFGDAGIEQGVITFASAPVWSDLRAGTIITLSEKNAIPVDTDWDTEGDDRNFTKGLDPGAADVTIGLATDLSFDPASDDWWIHVSTRGESAQPSPLVTTITNVDGDQAGDFSVGPDKWEMSIFDAGDHLQYGPIGEGITTFGNYPGGISGTEAGRLEADPDLTPLNNDNYDDVTSTTFGSPNEFGSVVQDFSRLRTTNVPEPASLALLGIGIAMLLLRRRGRRHV